MTPDASGWRSSERYDHVDAMTATDVAWEWLRRNEAYDKDFRALVDSKDDPHAMIKKIGRRWGLRFPRGPVAGSGRSARGLASPVRHQRHHSRRPAQHSARKH